MKVLLPLSALTALIACNEPTPATQPASATSSTATAATAAALSTVSTASISEGDMAPDVDLPLLSGKTTKLASLRGKPVVVYFYPKDQTPGCTIEAQGFRDGYADLKAAGIAVIGVSTQDASSHQAFIEKEKLPFDLAVDTNGTIARAFKVPVSNGLAARQTFLIGADGRIKKIWRQVNPTGHAAEILAAAKS